MLDINAEANGALIRHIERGGVNILLYGGNANLYHIDLGRLRVLLDLLVTQTGNETVVLPSIGPDLGRMLDAAPLLRQAGFRHAMALPAGFPSDPAGIECGLRLAVQATGFGLVLYVKRDGYLEPARIERLMKDGVIRFVKYAVERDDPFGDAYLADIVSAIGADHVASGMGETPLHAHIVEDDLATWTSGGVCIAPAAATALLAAYRAHDLDEAERLRSPFLAFEKVRMALGGISVLHDAVSMSGIADMGPILPMLSNIAEVDRPAVRAVTEGLLAAEATCRDGASRRSA
jgi:dihydrodipicolinate synthase/N-acetylneuraminate lyase